MAVYLARSGDLRQAGRKMLWAVAGFGIATIVFGFSRWFLLSLLALAVLGTLDQISVVVRLSLVQLRAPREVRGRVAAFNRLFISASNQLGAFESGLVASLIGTVPTVVVGGALTIAVVLIVARIWPQIGQMDRLSDDEVD
jgi:MFS family permease